LGIIKKTVRIIDLVCCAFYKKHDQKPLASACLIDFWNAFFWWKRK